MARAAETIVEDWLNRKGYFTIRGLKAGHYEIDLVAFSPQESEAIHVEVTFSHTPIGWISGNSIRKRSSQEIEENIEQFVQKKYLNEKTVEVRERLCPNYSWRFILVYGNLKYPEELPLLEQHGVKTVSVFELIKDLASGEHLLFKTDSDAAQFAALAASHANNLNSSS